MFFSAQQDRAEYPGFCVLTHLLVRREKYTSLTLLIRRERTAHHSAKCYIYLAMIVKVMLPKAPLTKGDLGVCFACSMRPNFFLLTERFGRAYQQAKEYFPGLKEHEQPSLSVASPYAFYIRLPAKK